MRIIALRIEEDDAALLIRLAVAVGIAQTQDLVARGQIHGAIGVNREVHCRLGALEEGGKAIRLAVAIGVLDEADAIVFRPLVVRRAKVGVALDDQQTAAWVEREADGVNDVRRGGEQIDTQARIVDLRILWRCFIAGICRRKDRADESEDRRHNEEAFHGKVTVLG